jgi:flagellar hook-associated protein 1 FlgK
MADLLNIGLSALIAQQRALTTTSNNIANASTPGYSRQRVEFAERSMERIGTDFIGTGVKVSEIRRLTDEAVAAQLRSASSGVGRASAFAELAETVNGLFADTGSGLTATLQSFFNALQDVANDPLSTSSRQALLSEARSVAARFNAMDRRLMEIGDEVRARMVSSTDRINALGAAIADVNKQIASSGTLSGQEAPLGLLDERDRLLEELASLVSVDTAPQTDGTLSVFIGTGQVLVIGGQSATLAVTPGDLDPEQPQIVLRGIGPDVNVTQFISGGQLGGALDFGREMLSPARSELGRIAVGLASIVNSAHRSGMDAEGQLGQDFFAVANPLAFESSANTGTGSLTVTISDVSALEPTNYTLFFDGTNYSLQRADNGAAVALTGAGTVANPLVADGLSIVVSGSPAASDRFLLKPLEHVGGTLRALVARSAEVAAAAPTRTSAALANTGTAAVSAGSIVDATDPNLLATATIQFLTPNTFSINGAGSFAYTPGADIDINGTRIQISGQPAVGDQFLIGANIGGMGDNRAVQQMLARLGQSVFAGETSLQDAAASLVTSVGSRTAEASNQSEVQQFMFDQNRERLDSVRGVNLDEEAANMLRYQQLYEAAAQTMAVANTLFNTLLSVLGR